MKTVSRIKHSTTRESYLMQLSDDKDNDVISFAESAVLDKLLNHEFTDYETNKKLVLGGYNLD